MDSHGGLSAQLAALVTGFADQKIKEGETFVYGGGRLFATDVAEIALPCTLVLADSLSRRLGMGGSGYEFVLGEPNPIFPVHAVQVQPRQFLEVAPYVAEVFESAVFQLRHDLSQVYVLAASAMGILPEDGVESSVVDAVPDGVIALAENPKAFAAAAGAPYLGR